MLTCQHCGSKGRIMVQTVITAPSDLYRLFSKKNLRSKDVRTHGTLWETCDFICGNEACGRVTNGYGNYVTNMKKENDRLRGALKDVESFFSMRRSELGSLSSEAEALVKTVLAATATDEEKTQ